MNKKLSTRMIAEAGIMMALAIVLSLIKLFEMPQGGSVTAGSMIPILIFALRWGVGPGMLVGGVYGIMQIVLGGYVFVPIQAVIDYPLAFAMLGFAGFMKKYFNDIKTVGDYIKIGLITFIAIFMRFICHLLSGVIFFSEYAGDKNPWLYSAGYNGSFLAVECAICIVLLCALAKPISKIKK